MHKLHSVRGNVGRCSTYHLIIGATVLRNSNLQIARWRLHAIATIVDNYIQLLILVVVINVGISTDIDTHTHLMLYDKKTKNRNRLILVRLIVIHLYLIITRQIKRQLLIGNGERVVCI